MLVAVHAFIFLGVLAVLTPLGAWATKDDPIEPLVRADRRRVRRGYLLVTASLAVLTFITG